MNEEKDANALLIILSVLIPIVGYVLYFTKRDDSPKPAKTYLWSAIAGSIVGLILLA